MKFERRKKLSSPTTHSTYKKSEKLYSSCGLSLSRLRTTRAWKLLPGLRASLPKFEVVVNYDELPLKRSPFTAAAWDLSLTLDTPKCMMPLSRYVVPYGALRGFAASLRNSLFKPEVAAKCTGQIIRLENRYLKPTRINLVVAVCGDLPAPLYSIGLACRHY